MTKSLQSDWCNNSNGNLINGDVKSGEPFVEDVSVKDELLQKIFASIQAIQVETKREIDKRLDIMSDQMSKEVDRLNSQPITFSSIANKQKSEGKRNGCVGEKSNALPEKEFLPRNSFLTDLFEVDHIKAIYNICVVIMFLTFLNTIVHDLVVDGTINLGLTPLIASFGKFHIGLGLWISMQTASSLIYYAFNGWAHIRRQFPNHRILSKYWDAFSILAFITYQMSFFFIFTKLVIYFDLPHGTSVSVLMEMTRFTMKVHAFVRSNAPIVLRFKEKTDDEKVLTALPTMTTYQYFLFCPTLIYRNSYPRTKYLQWNRVFKYLFEFFKVLVFLSFIFERFAMPYFGQFGQSEMTLSTLTVCMFGSIIPGIFIFLCGFYILLHVWLNMWAELLTFADRMFYQDWWTATSFDVYYRKWNVVVHDWLYTYIYKDLFENVFHFKWKKIATLTVFTISAIIHEYIIAFVFRFFYPVLFVSFEGFGVLMMFITMKNRKAFGNILLWGALLVGNGIQFSLYTIEHFARQNCDVGTTLTDYLLPVSWSCNKIIK